MKDHRAWKECYGSVVVDKKDFTTTQKKYLLPSLLKRRADMDRDFNNAIIARCKETLNERKKNIII